MRDDLAELANSRYAGLFGLWTAGSAFGTFLVQAIGYLALRHHLVALGVESDLAITSERYLFAGFRCLVHTVASLPQIVLILAMPAAVAWWLGRFEPVGRFYRRLQNTLVASQARLAFVGVVIATLSVQLVLRKPFHGDRLLLRDDLPDPAWLRALLFDHSHFWQPVYFGASLAVVLVVVAILRAAWLHPVQNVGSRALVVLLAALTLGQIMLVPIGYGILTTGADVPRVTLSLTDAALGVSDDTDLWLIWQTKDHVVLAARTPEQRAANGVLSAPEVRRLIRIAAKDIDRIESLCREPLLRRWYLGEGSPCAG